MLHSYLFFYLHTFQSTWRHNLNTIIRVYIQRIRSTKQAEGQNETERDADRENINCLLSDRVQWKTIQFRIENKNEGIEENVNEEYAIAQNGMVERLPFDACLSIPWANRNVEELNVWFGKWKFPPCVFFLDVINTS